ncbi:MAG: sel1 repeat family protein [Emcibacter sp.]|nr:sel1 repeat family protein [Emcibacter sp.]
MGKGDIDRQDGGVTQDIGRAKKYFTIACKAGLQKACKLKKFATSKQDVILKKSALEASQKKLEIARAKLKRLTRANAGDKEAQFELGEYYHKKKGQHPKAVKWYEAAANNGHGNAAFKMGREYISDGPIAKDIAKAVVWYKKSDDLGFLPAQRQLANIYFSQKAGHLNYREGLKYYHLAAARNDPSAQFSIGRAYANGFGVEQNFDAALEWITKATKVGNGFYKWQLGRYYDRGLNNFPKDKAKAEKWYIQSANQNYSLGKNALEKFYVQNPMRSK